MNIRVDINTDNNNASLNAEGSPEDVQRAFNALTVKGSAPLSKDAKEALIREFLSRFSKQYFPSKIPTIKAVRAVLGIGLKEAKDLVESI